MKLSLKWDAICKYLIENEKNIQSQSQIGTKLAKTKKQTIFRQNLFGNFYSTLNYILNGVQHVKLF